MKTKLFYLLTTLAFASAAIAQAQPPLVAAKGSISGVTRDANTGMPVPNVDVTAINPPARPVTATSDAQGRFKLNNLDAGRIQMAARPPIVPGSGFPPSTSKFLTLSSGEDATGLDIQVRTTAQVFGRVTDQNDQPVPGISVLLIAREYQLGELRYIFAGASRTDDEGKYVVSALPGRSYYLLAKAAPAAVSAISEAPLNPSLRRPSVIPTYFPNVEDIGGAQLLRLNSGDRMQNMDIRLKRGVSFCVEGTLSTGGATGELKFDYTEARPHSGMSGEGGLYMGSNSGKTSADGKVRVCHLHPGDYRFTVWATVGPQPLSPVTSYAAGTLTITDKDGTIQFSSVPRVKIPAELAWAQQPPESFVPPANWGALFPQAIARSGVFGESDIPKLEKVGPFDMELLADNYRLTYRNVPAGTYLKEMTYGGKSVLLGPLHPGSAAGEATLRIVLGRDGGTVATHVVDREGKAVPDQYAVVVPVEATSEQVLAELAIAGQTDQNGAWTSAILAPGAYYVFAMRTPLDKSPETIDALWRARGKAKQITVSSGGKTEVNLEPIVLQ